LRFYDLHNIIVLAPRVGAPILYTVRFLAAYSTLQQSAIGTQRLQRNTN
jgi:hypothetical protein